MTNLPPEALRVGEHYNATWTREAIRLDQEAPLERAITEHYLTSIFRAGSLIADIGVGAGHYAEALAAHGCDLILVDVSVRMLELTFDRLRRAGLETSVKSVHVACASAVEPIATSTCDG